MNGFRRWTIGICAKFDDLLGQVENHEALAAQALRDMRRSLARANAELARVEQDCRTLESEARTTQEHAARWRERARKEVDETRALECLKRSRSALEEERKLRERLEAQLKMHGQIRSTIAGLQQKFLDLSGKQRLLKTREAAARASEALHTEAGTAYEVEDVFSRWELQLTEREFVPGQSGIGLDDPGLDSFSESYLHEEERASLEAELSALRAESSPSNAAEKESQR